jgi:hypothetical protein
MLSDKYLWPVSELTPVHETYKLALFQEPVTETITGRGTIWQLLNCTKTERTISASYHAYNDNDNEYQPVEFINNQWHFIQWDNTEKFLGYWVFPNRNIPQGTFNLGWLGNILETQTPTTALSQF